MDFELTEKQTHRAFKALKDSIDAEQNSDDCLLSVANALWAQQGYELVQRYLDTIRVNYGEAVFEVDFSNGDKVADEINSWVAKQTRNKISELIGPGVLNVLTRLVLTNAIYFKVLN